MSTIAQLALPIFYYNHNESLKEEVTSEGHFGLRKKSVSHLEMNEVAAGAGDV
jgi:hypothetical protein